MSKFLTVTESKYGDQLYMNIDNIVAVHEASGTVYTNAVHGENTGIWHFDQDNMKKIVAALYEIASVHDMSDAHDYSANNKQESSLTKEADHE